jgi:hypothetical protein
MLKVLAASKLLWEPEISLCVQCVSQLVFYTLGGDLGGNFKQNMLTQHCSYFQPLWSYGNIKVHAGKNK